MDIKDKNIRFFGLRLNSESGKIELKRGNYHCSKSCLEGICVPCGFRFCLNCQVWQSFQDFIGQYKKKGNNCAECRDNKNSRQRQGSLSLKIRFQVLNRDKFTCQYCGRFAPNVILHIDHKQPVSKGGDDSFDNLITSCQDCNLGKSNHL